MVDDDEVADVVVVAADHLTSTMSLSSSANSLSESKTTAWSSFAEFTFASLDDVDAI